jgi:hypothetical protein
MKKNGSGGKPEPFASDHSFRIVSAAAPERLLEDWAPA